MDIKQVYELIHHMEGAGLSELDLEMEGVKLHLKGKDYSSKDSLKANEPGDPKVNEPDYLEVKAPLVGTFYRSPQPDAEPFVKEGQSLKKGDVIGIIEAMKLMNEITAPADGVVAKICVEDGAMVEYDTPLILISEA